MSTLESRHSYYRITIDTTFITSGGLITGIIAPKNYQPSQEVHYSTYKGKQRWNIGLHQLPYSKTYQHQKKKKKQIEESN